MNLLSIYRSGDYAAAESGVSGALKASPKDPNLLHLAAQIAEAQGNPDRAAMFFGRALEAHPNWVEAEFNLARVLSSQNRHEGAISLMTKVSLSRPDLPPVWECLAKFNQKAGNLQTAAEHWRKALKLAPELQEWRAQYIMLMRQICDWSVEVSEIEKLPPQAAMMLVDDPEIQKKSAVRYSQQKFGAITPMPPASWGNHGRIRIGYLSSDFHAHATSYLLAELFGLHNHTKFNVYVYSYGVDDKSATRERIKAKAEHFIELNNLSAKQAAEKIRKDEIDFLIDLKGHTRGARLEILAHRPARTQLHWLGFPGTLGTNFIDYFVGDMISIPGGSAGFFTEKLLRLPHSYQINDRERPIGRQLPREAYGLPQAAPVLASFNQTYKITSDMFAIWCGILRDIPSAVLWLYQSNDNAPDNLRAAATANGVDPQRIIFAPPLPLPEHLARYAHVDLAMDTFPVGGHTTTSDALWTGTPVVTLAGRSFVTRVAASLLTAVELPQLVTTTEKEYRELIMRLSTDNDELLKLKCHLRDKRSSLPLFDTPRFVKDFETALLLLNEKTH